MITDLSGQRHKQLTVKSFSHIDGRNYYWNCLCDCGKATVLTNSALKRQMSYGCFKTKGGKNSGSWRGIGDMPSSFYANIKSQAKFRGLEFSLTKQDFWDLFIKQERKCALSGEPLYFTERYKDSIHNKGTASLDRIDSLIGYIPGNVQWTHKDVNLMKQNFPLDRFIEVCKKIAETTIRSQ